MRCTIDGTHMKVTNTFEKRDTVERRQECPSCPFRCTTTELITDTRAFVKAFRKTIQYANAKS